MIEYSCGRECVSDTAVEEINSDTTTLFCLVHLRTLGFISATLSLIPDSSKPTAFYFLFVTLPVNKS